MAASMRLVCVAAFFGGVEQALAAVGLAGLLFDIAVVDQLAQHAGKALLGDFQDIEQVGNRHAGLEVDEIQDAVVGPAETLPFKQCISIADEVTVGEEEQAHDVERHGRLAGLRQIYVSLVDIYFARCHHHPIENIALCLIPKPFRFANSKPVGQDHRQ